MRVKKHSGRSLLRRDAPVEASADNSLGSDSIAGTLRADGRLARRCVQGEVKAWEELYAQCHESLCMAVRVMLGHGSDDCSLVDEIAARVWYALVANDGALLARFDPKRGTRLITFMRALAKDEISRHFRSEFRRRERELVAARGHNQRVTASADGSIDSLGEFLDTLTEHERGFCHEYLLTEPPQQEKQAFSTANIWQLSRRIYQKLASFVDCRT